MTPQTKKIVLLPGDGIGPEIVRVAVRVLKDCAAEFGHRFEFEEYLFEGCAIDATGVQPDLPVDPQQRNTLFTAALAELRKQTRIFR